MNIYEYILLSNLVLYICNIILFLNKVAGQACNFIKKEPVVQLLSGEFCEISKNIFYTEHLRTTASVIST